LVLLPVPLWVSVGPLFPLVLPLSLVPVWRVPLRLVPASHQSLLVDARLGFDGVVGFRRCVFEQPSAHTVGEHLDQVFAILGGLQVVFCFFEVDFGFFDGASGSTFEIATQSEESVTDGFADMADHADDGSTPVVG
jgi:hypothetical protein